MQHIVLSIRYTTAIRYFTDVLNKQGKGVIYNKKQPMCFFDSA